MIRTRQEALAVLGLSNGATAEQIKSAYRKACKLYHPDNAGGVSENQKMQLFMGYQRINEAYEFLTESNTGVVGARIVGTPMTSNYDKSNLKRKEQLEKGAKERKEQRLRELQEEGRRLSQEKKAAEILDEIRWLRVAELIRETMNEDKRRKELEEKIKTAIKNKQ